MLPRLSKHLWQVYGVEPIGFRIQKSPVTTHLFPGFLTGKEPLRRIPTSDFLPGYTGRGDAENRIKELKTDFGFDSFNLKSFQGTESALTFAMLAYNLMALFRQFVIKGKTQQTLSTLRYKTFAIGAYFEKTEDTFVLKLALNLKRREWFEGLWGKSKLTTIPLYKT